MLVSCDTTPGLVFTPLAIPGAHYAGNQACADCHKDIVRNFPASPHARVHLGNSTIAGLAGCESGHGPGSKYIESGGGGTFIINPRKDPTACLQIVGSEEVGPDLSSITPVISATTVGNQAVIKWNWGGYGDFLDSCEIMVDRGDGKGYTLLTIDTTPGYTDTQPFPAVRTVWTYRAIYRVNDGQVGVWSAPVSIPVAV